MLAREIKIRTLVKQQRFIEEQLRATISKEDGNPSYKYIGQVYPEVIEYFEKSGFSVIEVNSSFLRALTHGQPVYLFRISNEIKLTENELKQSAEYAEGDIEEDSEGEENIFKKFLENLGGLTT